MDSATAQAVTLRVFDGHNDAALAPRAGRARTRRRASWPATARAISTCRAPARRAGRRLLRGLHVLAPGRGYDVGRLLRAVEQRAGARRGAGAGGAAAAAGARRRAGRAGRARRRRTSTGPGSRPCCTSRAPSRSARRSTSSRCCTRPGCARSGWSGAARTRSRRACPFGFPGSPDQGPGLTDAGRELVQRVRRAGDPRRRLAPQRARLLGRGRAERGAARRLALAARTRCARRRAT